MTNESSFLKLLLTLVIGLFLVLHGDSQVAFAADAPEVIA